MMLNKLAFTKARYLPPFSPRWVLCLFFIFLVSREGKATAHPSAQTASPRLVAIYLCALDNDLSPHADEIIQEVGAATIDHPEKIAILLCDQDGPADTKIHVFQNGVVENPTGLPDLNGVLQAATTEYNMSDGATLGGFLRWMMTTYVSPGDKTLLTVIGHGLPLAPVTELPPENSLRLNSAELPTFIPLPSRYTVNPNSFNDMHPTPTLLTPMALAQALKAATVDLERAPINVIDLVQCFSATIEQLYEIKPYVQTTIATPGYRYLIPAALRQVIHELTGAMEATTMARVMADIHRNTLVEGHPGIIVAIDNSQLANVKESWDALSVALQQKLVDDGSRTRSLLKTIHQRVRKYDTTIAADDWAINNVDALADLGDLAFQVKNAFASTPIASTAEQAITHLQQAILTSQRHSGQPWRNPGESWHFDRRYQGVAIFADFMGNEQNGQIELNWVAHYYDPDNLAGDNSHPYRFIANTITSPVTWGDVFQSYWEPQRISGTLITTAGLPSLTVITLTTPITMPIPNATPTLTPTPTPVQVQITIAQSVQPTALALAYTGTGAIGDFILTPLNSSRHVTVDSGSYTVQQAVPTEWSLSAIRCTSGRQVVVDLSNNQVRINTTAEVTAEAITCTFVNQQNVLINSLIYDDRNGNGAYNNDEPGLTGWTVRVYRRTQEVASSSTDSDGRSTFHRRLPPDTYTVCIDLVPGWRQLAPDTLDPTFGKPCRRITVAPGQSSNLTFGVTEGAAE